MKDSKFKIIIKYLNKKPKSTTARNNISNTRSESLVVQLVGLLLIREDGFTKFLFNGSPVFCKEGSVYN